MSDYQNKPEDYYVHARVDVLQLLQGKSNLKILELGAGGGYTLAEAKRLGIASYVAGVELFPLEGTLQKDAILDEFHHADLNLDVLELNEKSFDVLICPDVLEHLVDPWSVLEKWSKYLKKDGLLIISIPNIREMSVMWKIFGQGDFGYTSDGILDRTHLRFFAKKNLFHLPSHQQFHHIEVKAAMHFQNGSRWRKWANRLTIGIFESFFTHQWFVTAIKK